MATLMLDVDGVLVRSKPIWTHRLEADLGISPDALISAFFTRHWAKIITGEQDLFDGLRAAWPDLGTSVQPEALVDYWFRTDARIVPSVLSDCAALRRAGHRVFLATNQEHYRARYLMETLRLAAHVDGIRYSAELGVCKPDAAFFKAAARGIQGRIILIDDTKANVVAAREAGWGALHWEPEMSLAHVFEVALTASKNVTASEHDARTNRCQLD